MIEFIIGFTAGVALGIVIGIIYVIDSIKKRIEKMGFNTMESYFRSAMGVIEGEETLSVKHIELGGKDLKEKDKRYPELENWAGTKEYQEAIKDRKEVKD
jgi:hypothetical protein